MAASSGKVADLYMQTATTSTAFTTEATTAASGNLRYTIDASAKRYWILNDDFSGNADTVTVYVDASAVTANSGYTLERAGGVVVFDSDPSATVTVTGRYATVAVRGYFFNWSLDRSCESIETTSFDDSGTGNRTYIPGLMGWTATGELYTQDDTYWNLADGDTVVMALFQDASAHWEGHVMITNHTQTVPVEGMVTTSITFQGCSPNDAPTDSAGVYYRDLISGS